MPDVILKLAEGQGFPVLLLLVAIYWMNRNNSDLFGRLHAERAERLDKLEAMAASCEKDRRQLWEKLLARE